MTGLCKKGPFGETHKGVKTQGECHSQAKQHRPPEARRDLEHSPPQPSEGTSPDDTWISDFWLPGL